MAKLGGRGGHSEGDTVGRPLCIAMIPPDRLRALVRPRRGDTERQGAGALIALLRKARARGVGWRGQAPDRQVREALRAAGVVAAAVGQPEALPLTDLAQLAAEGPLLVVVEAPQSADALRDWLSELAALRAPTLRVALHRVPRCAAPHFRGDVDVVLTGVGPATALQPACSRCAVVDSCAGAHPSAHVQPLALPVSNQFDLVEMPSVAVPDSLPTDDVARHLWLQTADGLRRFRCDNTGWTTGQLADVLNDLGQAWLDVSEKARLDDFATDLRALRRIRPAERQADGTWRPALWELAEGTPFAEAEAALGGSLAELTGLVVDIGAGPIRYLKTLAERIASGALRYVAVEPDAAELQRTAAALPGAMLTRGVGERLPLQTGCADHVLMLRSFNHLRDVPAAFAEASRVARPGATLLVVDNVAFGLARTQAQISRARAIAVNETPFEHYRNANADAAVAAIDATGDWQIGSVQSVGPGRANQWMVRAKRR